MHLTEKQQRGQEVMNTVIAKCWEDEAFKQELIASPVATLEKFTEGKFKAPEGVTVVVHDQSDPNYFHFNIPQRPDAESLELTDEQLEAVAGGVSPTVIYGGIFVAAVCLGYFSGD